MSNISLTINNEGDSKIMEFNIDGEANVRNEEEFFNLIGSGIYDHDSFLIKLRDIKNIDLPFLQLLLSINKTIKSQNKNIRFEFEISAATDNIIKNAGIDIEKLFETSVLKITNIS